MLPFRSRKAGLITSKYILGKLCVCVRARMYRHLCVCVCGKENIKLSEIPMFWLIWSMPENDDVPVFDNSW